MRALPPGSGTFTQTAQSTVPGGPDGQIYQYNAELANPFPEQAGTVYWLKIVALNSNSSGTAPVEWGWHNRDYTIPDPYAAAPGDSIVGTNDADESVNHYMDDAVTGDITYGPNAAGLNTLTETDMSPLDYGYGASFPEDGF